MFAITISNADSSLLDLIEKSAAVLDCAMAVETRTVIATNNRQLASIVCALTDQVLPEDLQQINVKAKTETAPARVCLYCGNPVSGKSKICGEPECKKKQTADYNRTYLERKKSQVGTSEASAVPEDEQENAGTTETPPFDWPAGTVWRVMTGKNAGHYLAAWELSDRLEDLVAPGEKVLHRTKGIHTAVERTSGGISLRRARPEPEAGK